MNLDCFKKLSKDDFKKYNDCTKGLYNNSESSFATIYMWQHYANVKYYIDDGVVYSIFNNKNGELSSFMPYGLNRSLEKTVDKLIDLYHQNNSRLVLNLCTEDFVDFLTKTKKYNISVYENRNSFDYVYLTNELIELKGKRFHGKKNHFNSFTKKYSYEYLKYNSSLKNDCIKFCSDILKIHYGDNIRGYETELFSISKTFENMHYFDLKCGIIVLNEKIIALSVGEKLNDDYALIHIEKADYNYREAYSVINRLFLMNEFSDTIYVNREEDMGIEGLRKAKMSYNPCHLIKKYTVEFN